MSKVDYIRRVGAVARHDPSEFFYRVRGQWEVRSERGDPGPALKPRADWIGALHELLDVPSPCDTCEGFQRVWETIAEDLTGSGHVLGKGYDAGIDLARGAYAATRHLMPLEVVETGVARGVTSRVILEALQENEIGALHSIDLPPLAEGWHTQAAIAVPPALRRQWDYRRGASRRILPKLLEELGDITLFIHDSLHTYANMTWELQTAWDHVEPGGLLLCDDVEDNRAFEDFVRPFSDGWIVGKEERRTGLIGALRRPART